jgi:hypothetical protein
MIKNEKYKEKYKQVKDNFQKAEIRIKSIELLHNELSIPSINELRYAGHHILNAIQEDESQKILRELDKANRHTKRAYYDAVESVLLYSLDEIKIFDNEYKIIPETLDVIDNYNGKISEINNIVHEIENIEYETRDEKYIKIDEYYSKIEKTNKELKNSTTSIVALIDRNNQAQKKEHRKFIISSLLTTLGIVVAIIIALR